MFKKILVPLDGSELAAGILPQVAELAQKFQAELILLHVCPGEEPEVAAAAAPGAGRVCAAYLGLLGKELKAQGLQVNWVCLTGAPAREIIRYAQEQKVDLLALATHGRGEVAWLLGSIAKKVLTHASVPVMLFRLLGKEPPKLKAQAQEFM